MKASSLLFFAFSLALSPLGMVGALAQQAEELQFFLPALEKPFYEAGACRTPGQATWSYARTFGLLVASMCCNGREKPVQTQKGRVHSLERRLGVVAPDRFPREGTKVLTSVQAVIRFSKGKGHQPGRETSDQFGSRAGALFELGIKGFLSSRFQGFCAQGTDPMDKEMERLGKKTHRSCGTMARFQDLYREKDGKMRATILVGFMDEPKKPGTK